jgi:hypothetical protein
MLSIDLTETERRLLRGGMVEWSGPARCTEEMALAMASRASRISSIPPTGWLEQSLPGRP